MEDVTRRRWGDGLLRWLVDAVDRGPVWGSIQIRPEPYGIVRYRLTVYPPGTDLITRRWLCACEAWAGAGLIGATTAAILLMLVVPPALALSLSAAIYAVGWIVVRHGSGVARRATRTLVALDFGDRSTTDEEERCMSLRCAAAMMVDADRSLRARLLTPVEHEVIWLEVFTRVGTLAAARRRQHV